LFKEHSFCLVKRKIKVREYAITEFAAYAEL